MNKFLRPIHLPLITVGAGLLGLLLRIWTIGKGPDAETLYEPQAFAWVLLWIVTALALGLVFFTARQLKDRGSFSDNFPASPVAAVGCGLGAVGTVLSALQLLTSARGTMATVGGVLGLAAGLGLVVTAIARFRGTVPNFLCHTAVCLFFAVQIFCQCRIWSDEPQVGVFVFPFLAMICAMLAAFQLAAFDAGMGKRRASVLWSLSGVYFSLLALPGNANWLFYGCIALWLLTDLCSLRPLNKRRTGPEVEAQEPELQDAQPNILESDLSLDELKNWLDDK